VVIVLPVMVRTILQAMSITGAPAPVVAATAVILVPLVAAGLVWAVWHWRHDMAAWFEGMVAEKDLFRAGKLALARIGGSAASCSTPQAACSPSMPRSRTRA
jgi:hypothetical protein